MKDKSIKKEPKAKKKTIKEKKAAKLARKEAKSTGGFTIQE